MPADHASRRFIPFSEDMNKMLEKLHIAYPAISKAQLTAEAARRGMGELLSVAGSVPTLAPQVIVEQLRRVG